MANIMLIKTKPISIGMIFAATLPLIHPIAFVLPMAFTAPQICFMYPSFLPYLHQGFPCCSPAIDRFGLLSSGKKAAFVDWSNVHLMSHAMLQMHCMSCCWNVTY